MTRKPSPKPRDIVSLEDLSPRRRVTGGSQSRVFGADAPAGPTRDAGASRKATRDLSAKSHKVKGGGRDLNDNITLVRAARPATSDLPAPKDVNGGKKLR